MTTTLRPEVLNRIVSHDLLEAIETAYQNATDRWVGETIPEKQDACEAEDLACDAMIRAEHDEWDQALEDAAMLWSLTSIWHTLHWNTWLIAIYKAAQQYRERQEAIQETWRPTEADVEDYYHEMMGD